MIKAEARRLGFALVGITTPDPPEHFPLFESWLRAGMHGEMGYLASERSLQRRADPRQILPECRSILVLGIPYPSNPYEEVSSLPLHGRVASYAWGVDYHDLLPERLRTLVAFIEDQVGQSVPNRYYTDSGPILERDLAQRAGLGWIGKNTCLIHPRQGSYFLLAEVLLGIDLPADAPCVDDYCGSCTRCIQACPTGCILPDRTIDARRCISYLTIELKAAIPIGLRPLIGDWVFGCDVCQQVCPWNVRFAPMQGDLAFAPRPGIPQPDLITELSLSAAEFNRKFKRSPIQRARRRGYLRNIAVALGNQRHPAAIPALGQALRDEPEALVRAHAAWALGQIGGQAAQEILRTALEYETDDAVRSEILGALQSQN